MTLRTIISAPKAPKAVGPYAQAVRYGDLLFVSGMLPIDPKTNELVNGASRPSAPWSWRTSRPSWRPVAGP